MRIIFVLLVLVLVGCGDDSSTNVGIEHLIVRDASAIESKEVSVVTLFPSGESEEMLISLKKHFKALTSGEVLTFQGFSYGRYKKKIKSKSKVSYKISEISSYNIISGSDYTLIRIVLK